MQIGMGRSGTLFAYQQENIEPDIIALAKGLGGGFQELLWQKLK